MILATLTSAAQIPSKESKRPFQPPRVVQDVLLQARLSPPETKVDTIMRIVQSNKEADLAWRRELLEEAYIASGDVKNLSRRKVVRVKGVSVDTHAGYLSYAYDLKLDRLSLLARVIKQMVTIDKARARLMLIEMNGRLGIKPIGCQEVLVYDVADIYGALGTVAKSAFTKTEIADGVRALFLASWLENIESPTQIGPALDLLKEFASLRTEKYFLFTALARGINRNFRDDRSFTFVLEQQRLLSKISLLTGGTEDTAKSYLRAAFRDFLSKNLGDSRCSDNAISSKDELPRYLAEANLLFPDKPFIVDDIVTSDLLDNPKVSNYWQSGISRKLSAQLRGLRFNSTAETLSASFKPDEEWQGRVTAFLENLDSWRASDDEPESDVFNQKAVLYRTLLRMISESAAIKKSVFRSYVRFLNGSPMQKENFIEWYLHVSQLVTSEPKLFDEMVSEVPNSSFRLMAQLKRLGI